jgi:hypothetical protein
MLANTLFWQDILKIYADQTKIPSINETWNSVPYEFGQKEEIYYGDFGFMKIKGE